MNLSETLVQEEILKCEGLEREKHEAKRFQNTRRILEYRQSHETETARQTGKKRNRERQRKRRKELAAAIAAAAAQKPRQEEMLLPPNLSHSQFLNSMLAPTPFNLRIIVPPFYAPYADAYWPSQIPRNLFVPLRQPPLQPKPIFPPNQPAESPQPPIDEKENTQPPDVPRIETNKRKRNENENVQLKETYRSIFFTAIWMDMCIRRIMQFFAFLE